jgi:hypothetical protein
LPGDADEHQYDGQLDDYDAGVEVCGFLDADDQNYGDSDDGQEGDKVE